MVVPFMMVVERMGVIECAGGWFALFCVVLVPCGDGGLHPLIGRPTCRCSAFLWVADCC